MKYQFKKIPTEVALPKYLKRNNTSCDPGQECGPDCGPNCDPGYCSPDYPDY
ncbi:MAG: hypothetical protein ACOCTT_00885 [archaeon]